MGEWHFSEHFTAAAQSFEKKIRAAQIAIFVEECLPRLRDTARTCGYTLAIHGSLCRDLDIVAVPWVNRAVSKDELLTHLASTCRDLTGWGIIHSNDWVEKPHGRMATTIIAASDVHLDLSVMPLLVEEEEGE